MSNPNRARQPSGTPVGGQFASEPRDSAEVALAPTPIDLAWGQEITLDGDGQVITEYTVLRSQDAYEVSARTGSVTSSYLLDAEDTYADTYEEVMSGPRWREMTRFLEERYEAVTLIEGVLADELAFDVNASFDTAPTQEQVIDATWNVAARIANETDRGTYGSPFVGTDLTKHLDAHVFVDDYPIHSGDKWWPRAPLTYDEAMTEGAASQVNDSPISDRSAQALAKELADNYFDSAYFTLRHMGRVSRGELENAVAGVRPEHKDAARALATWSAKQPPTSELLSPPTHAE